VKVYNPQTDRTLHDDLRSLLACVRAERGFDAGGYVAAKTDMINAYLAAHGLAGCVVGLSGGLDSAVALALVSGAASKPGSPIRRIIPVLLPVDDRVSATRQSEATRLGLECATALGLSAAVVDLGGTHRALKAAVDAAVGVTGEAWASGQLVAYARTPALYYTTSLCSQQGIPAVVVGTTNRDEGAYLGYVGKAADGMTDLQIISDLHKSEVRAVAQLTGVPSAILRATPSGDMYDGRVDEEVFGAPYDFVELYLGWLCATRGARQQMLRRLSAPARQQFQELAQRLEHLHDYNAHKYLVGSPAVHLDLYPSAVPGGWQPHPLPS